MKKNKILVNTTDLSRGGGVSQYLNNLNLDSFPGIEYYNIQVNSTNRISFLIGHLKRYFGFIKKLKGLELVHINPSLDIKSFYRDMVYVLLAKIFQKKIVITMHGWEDKFEEKIKRSKWLGFLFKISFGNVSNYIVLGQIFKSKLIGLGVERNANFFIETTVVPDLEDNKLLKKKLKFPIKFLFMSRIEIEKGIYIAIDTFNALSKKVECEFFIAGIGPELEKAKAYVKSNNIKGVTFTGFLSGNLKSNILSESHIFLFPTYYGEGLPTAILEAMLYGMPIISRYNAAIPEIVENGVNGFLTDSLDYNVFTSLSDELIKTPSSYSKISKRNQEIAREKFVASKVRERILRIYKTILENEI